MSNNDAASSEETIHLARVPPSDFNFRWEQEEYLKYKDSTREWPFWRVEKRYWNPDKRQREYELRWLHPDTWETEYQTIPEHQMAFSYTEADEDEMIRIGEEITDD